GQLFIRKAVTRRLLLGHNSGIPAWILSFMPLLGPVHISLNARESVVLVFHFFFEMMFRFVFGKNKPFPRKPKPWRITLLLYLAMEGWKKIKEAITEKFDFCRDPQYCMMVDLLDNLIPASWDVWAVYFRSGCWDAYESCVFRLWTMFFRF